MVPWVTQASWAWKAGCCDKVASSNSSALLQCPCLTEERTKRIGFSEKAENLTGLCLHQPGCSHSTQGIMGFQPPCQTRGALAIVRASREGWTGPLYGPSALTALVFTHLFLSLASAWAPQGSVCLAHMTVATLHMLHTHSSPQFPDSGQRLVRCEEAGPHLHPREHLCGHGHAFSLPVFRKQLMSVAWCQGMTRLSMLRRNMGHLLYVINCLKSETASRGRAMCSLVKWTPQLPITCLGNC